MKTPQYLYTGITALTSLVILFFYTREKKRKIPQTAEHEPIEIESPYAKPYGWLLAIFVIISLILAIFKI